MILSIQSAVPPYSVALCQNDVLLAELQFLPERSITENLVQLVQSLCDQIQKPISDIQSIVAVSGPGSFTGIRLGVTTANTLAQVLNVPSIGVSYFESVAWSLKGLQNVALSVLPISPTLMAGQLWAIKPEYIYELSPFVTWRMDQFKEQVQKLSEGLIVGPLSADLFEWIRQNTTVETMSFSLSAHQLVSFVVSQKIEPKSRYIVPIYAYAPYNTPLAGGRS